MTRDPALPSGRIETMADIAAGVAALAARDPVFGAVHAAVGLPPLRRRPGGIEGLALIVTGQQVSVASAQAIWARTQDAFAPFEPARLLAADEAAFRAAGQSGAKARTLRAIAAAVEAGLDLDALAGLEAEAAHAALTAIKGIGPWTADLYLLACIGHADAFPAGDLALQEAARLAFGLEARPSAAAFSAMAERWRPLRAIAARLLWSYYASRKGGREGLAVPSGGST